MTKVCEKQSRNGIERSEKAGVEDLYFLSAALSYFG